MVYCDDSLGSRVADCTSSGHGISRQQDHANVRLIAAAPTMLDALKSAESALASCYQVCDYPANGRSDQDYALSEVRDAIAKAESRS